MFLSRIVPKLTILLLEGTQNWLNDKHDDFVCVPLFVSLMPAADAHLPSPGQWLGLQCLWSCSEVHTGKLWRFL